MKIVGQILLGVSFIMVLTASRCSSAVKLTNKFKTSVNSATQVSKKLGNKAAASAAENSNIQRGVVIGGSRMVTTQVGLSYSPMHNFPRCNQRE